MRGVAQAKGEEWRKEEDEQRWCDRLWLGSIQMGSWVAGDVLVSSNWPASPCRRPIWPEKRLGRQMKKTVQASKQWMLSNICVFIIL